VKKITLFLVALLFILAVGVVAFADMKPADIVGNWLIMQESSADQDGLTLYEKGSDSYVIFKFKDDIICAPAFNKNGVNHVATYDSGEYVTVSKVSIFTDSYGKKWYHFYDNWYNIDVMLKFHNKDIVYGYAINDDWTLKIVLKRSGTFDLKSE